MFGSATSSNTGFGSFGAPASSIASAQPPTNSLFGAGGFGASSTTTAAPPTTSLFGGASTNTTVQPATNSLFGNTTSSAAAPGTNSLFGASNPLFGGSTLTSTAPTAATNSLFGGGASASTGGFGLGQTNNTLFSTQQQQQAQQAQHPEQGLLDLSYSFPDKSVPHFLITKDKITRTTVPANFFLNTSSNNTTSSIQHVDNSTAKERKFNQPLSSSFIERNQTLPNYLSASDNGNSSTTNNKSNLNSYTTKKRILEEGLTDKRNVLPKNNQGVFTHQNDMPFGFAKNLSKQGNKLPPVNSLKEVGIQPSTTTTTTLTVMDSTPTSLSPIITTTTNNGTKQDTRTRVRVFGYTEENVVEIIKRFEAIGESTHEYSNTGNWIIFEYRTPEAAKAAIELNGLNVNAYLIGVAYDEPLQEIDNHISLMTFTPTTATTTSTNTDLFTKSTDSSFMNSYNHQFNRNKQDQKDQDAAAKKQNLLGFIRENVFGW